MLFGGAHELILDSVSDRQLGLLNRLILKDDYDPNCKRSDDGECSQQEQAVLSLAERLQDITPSDPNHLRSEDVTLAKKSPRNVLANHLSANHETSFSKRITL